MSLLTHVLSMPCHPGAHIKSKYIIFTFEKIANFSLEITTYTSQ